MNETDLYDPIKKTLERIGCIVTRVHSGKVKVRGGWMQLADEGTPDHHVMCPDGSSFWLETKTQEGDLSPAQRRWHERAKKSGHRVAVVRSPREALAVVGQRAASVGNHAG
jgi:hypothetical protein